MIFKQKQSGTTLIEILVSVVVMAIGLLGVAGLQMNALKFQKTSSQRSEATQAAYDLGERMRANWVISGTSNNMANEARYTYNVPYATSSTATPQTVDCKTVICAADQIAASDRAEWLRNIQRRLVGGGGLVVPVPGGVGSTFSVTVMWKEQGLTTTDTSCPDAAAAPIGVRCFNLRFSV